MSFARVYGAQISLLKGQIVSVEVDMSRGLNAFAIVGLPDKAVEEAKDRVSSAIKNSGFVSPKHINKKTVVSLAPAEMKKEGSFFDLAIALAYLLSAEFIKFNPNKKIFLGELSLNGELQEIRGTIPIVQTAKDLGYEEIYLPKQNAEEAALIEGIKIFGVSSLQEIIAHIREDISKSSNLPKIKIQPKTIIKIKKDEESLDFSDVRGQESAKRGLEIAAAGGHNITMYGPPGTGKTMLARVFSKILPDLSLDEILEITGIHSAAGVLKDGLVIRPPFRSPHHTSSYVSLIGGGAFPKPGEVTLAHKGVLFLDEFPEFDKKVLESLRQPLEDNFVSIARAKGTAIFPSNFILIAAMNPCPCGYYGSKQKECICQPSDFARYKRKVSGPIMDRIDLWVSVGAVDFKKLSSARVGENNNTIRKRVTSARNIQIERFKKAGKKIKLNSEMGVKDLESLAILSQEAQKILNESSEKLNLSARAYHRVIKIGRTIADLSGELQINPTHILEAIQYRPRS